MWGKKTFVLKISPQSQHANHVKHPLKYLERQRSDLKKFNNTSVCGCIF